MAKKKHPANLGFGFREELVFNLARGRSIDSLQMFSVINVHFGAGMKQQIPLSR